MSDFKRYILVLLLGLLAIALQGTILKAILPDYLVPSFVLIIVVYLGFFEVRLSSLFLVFLLGLELDLASGLLVGPWSGAFVVVFLLLALLAQRIFVESIVSVLVAVFFASLTSDLVYFILIYRLEPAVYQVIFHSIVGAMVNSLFAPPVFILLRRVLIRKDKKFSAYR
jgi:rod shape-determining protein MreD